MRFTVLCTISNFPVLLRISIFRSSAGVAGILFHQKTCSLVMGKKPKPKCISLDPKKMGYVEILGLLLKS